MIATERPRRIIPHRPYKLRMLHPRLFGTFLGLVVAVIAAALAWWMGGGQ